MHGSTFLSMSFIYVKISTRQHTEVIVYSHSVDYFSNFLKMFSTKILTCCLFKVWLRKYCGEQLWSWLREINVDCQLETENKQRSLLLKSSLDQLSACFGICWNRWGCLFFFGNLMHVAAVFVHMCLHQNVIYRKIFPLGLRVCAWASWNLQLCLPSIKSRTTAEQLHNHLLPPKSLAYVCACVCVWSLVTFCWHQSGQCHAHMPSGVT